MGTLWPKSGLIARDNNDDRAIGALAYFTDAGTSTPKAVYEDGDETTAHADPVATDGNGRWPAVFIPFGSYKERITTSAGSAIGSTVDDIPNPAPFDEAQAVDPENLYSTGDGSWGLGNETRSGWVRLNGRTIGNASSSATERANADTVDLFTHIYNRCADAQAAVSGGRGASAAADYAANKRIALPDWRAAGLRGFDDMGNSAASLLGSAPVVLGSTILPGSILGANTHTLTTAQLASHTHTGTTSAGSAHSHAILFATQGVSATHTHSGTTGTESATHTHAQAANTMLSTGGAGALAGAVNILSSGGTTGTESATHTHTITTGNESNDHVHTVNGTSDPEATHTHTFTSATSGSGTAHNNVARDALVTFYIKL
jgi:hypothetical protein